MADHRMDGVPWAQVPTDGPSPFRKAEPFSFDDLVLRDLRPRRVRVRHWLADAPAHACSRALLVARALDPRRRVECPPACSSSHTYRWPCEARGRTAWRRRRPPPALARGGIVHHGGPCISSAPEPGGPGPDLSPPPPGFGIGRGMRRSDAPPFPAPPYDEHDHGILG